jgi:hypothetical protein
MPLGLIGSGLRILNGNQYRARSGSGYYRPRIVIRAARSMDQKVVTLSIGGLGFVAVRTNAARTKAACSSTRRRGVEIVAELRFFL